MSTMEFSIMYDSDLSLFGGDLLVDLPLADSELYESSASDGLLSKPSKWLDVTSGISQDVSFAVGHTDQKVLHDPYSDNWLDSKMDLLELMCLQDNNVNSPGTTNHYNSLEEMPFGSVLEPSAHAVQLLKEAAKEAADFLDNIESEPSSVHATDSESLDLLDMLYSSIPDGTLEIMNSPDALVPMSPEDMESFLSSEPASPSSLGDDESILSGYMCSDTSASDLSNDNTMGSFNIPDEVVVDSDLAHLLLSVEAAKGYTQLDSQPVVIHSKSCSSRAKPYDRKQGIECKASTPIKEVKNLDKKLRKKQQNKDAAIRYRQKKRSENEAINGELEELDARNKHLKDTVGQMTGEIKYLKDLLAEVYQSRGLKLKSIK